MCFAEFASLYAVRASTSQSAADEDENQGIDGSNSEVTHSKQLIKLRDELGYISKRNKPAIIRYPRFRKSIDSERYHQNLLTVYFPHYSKRLTTADITTYEEFFNLPEVKATTLANMEKFEKLSDELDAAFVELGNTANLENAWAATAPSAEEARIQEETDALALQDLYEYEECESTPLPELHEPILYSTSTPTVQSTPSAANLLPAMNARQQQLYHFIQMHCLKVLHNERPPPFYVCLTGGAGTGKSHLVHCIYHTATKIFSQITDSADQVTVLKLAPTGQCTYLFPSVKCYRSKHNALYHHKITFTTVHY